MPVDTLGAVIVIVACIGFLAYMLYKEAKLQYKIDQSRYDNTDDQNVNKS